MLCLECDPHGGADRDAEGEQPIEVILVEPLDRSSRLIEVRQIAEERGIRGPMADRYRLDLNLAHDRFCTSRIALHAFLEAAGLAAKPAPEPCPPPGTQTLPKS